MLWLINEGIVCFHYIKLINVLIISAYLRKRINKKHKYFENIAKNTNFEKI
jgi:hypothetical protein